MDSATRQSLEQALRDAILASLHVPGLAARRAELRQELQDARLRARAHTREHGTDIPAVADWQWPHPGTTDLAIGKEPQ